MVPYFGTGFLGISSQDQPHCLNQVSFRDTPGVMSDPMAALPAAYEAADSFLERLFQFAIDSDNFTNYREIAWERFFGPMIPAGQVPEDHPDWDAFDDWFIFDFVLNDGLTPFQRFARDASSHVPPEEKAFVEGWHGDVFGVFSVVSVSGGGGAVLKHLATGDTYRVPNVKLTRRGNRWDHLIGRIIPVAGVYGFTSSPRYLSPGLIEQLPTDFSGGKPPAADVRARAVEFWRVVRRLAAEQPRVPITEEGDPVRPSNAEYQVADVESVAAMLRRLRYLKKIDDVPDGEQWFDWVGVPNGGGQRTVLGTIRLTVDRLIFECLTPERVDRGKKLIEPALGAAISHLSDHVSVPAEQPLSAEDSARSQSAAIALGEMLVAVSRGDRFPAVAKTADGSEASALLTNFETEPMAILAGLHHEGASVAVNRVRLGGDRANVEIALELPDGQSFLSNARLVEQGSEWKVEAVRPGGIDTVPSEAVGDDPVLISFWTGTWQWAPVGPVADHPILGIALARLHRSGKPLLEQVLAIRLWQDYVARTPTPEGGDEDWAIGIGEITDWIGGRTQARPINPLSLHILDALRLDFPDDKRYVLDRPLLPPQ